MQVENIALIKRPFINKSFYSDLKYNGSVLSWSAIRTEWSIKEILEMYSSRNFKIIDVNEKIENFYKENADEERDYLCIDNTLYVGYYIY